MVHSESSERKKRKPRGRPFTSEYNPKKSKRDVLDVEGHSSGDEGGVVNPVVAEEIKEWGETFENSSIETQLPQSVATESLKEAFDEYNQPPKEEKPKEGPFEEVLEEIEFKRGKDTLKIVFKKNHNRLYRMQVFLNGTTEIRPVTWTGSTTANAFWGLLKGNLSRE